MTDLSPMEYVKANGFIDFPHAWTIARRTAPEYHHNECSFNTTGGALLCDCEVLTKSPEYVLAYATSPTVNAPAEDETTHPTTAHLDDGRGNERTTEDA